MAAITEDDSPTAPSTVPLPTLTAIARGTSDNDLTGTPARTGAQYINDNFALILGALQRCAPQAWEVTAVQTADYTATVGGYCIRMDTTSANKNVTLPVAADVEGHEFEIVKWDSSGNDVILVKDAADSWYGTTGSLTSQYEVVRLRALPDGWLKVN